MDIHVQFYSYFKELTGCDRAMIQVDPGSSLGLLHILLIKRFPRLESMQKSTLIAVGVEYQTHDYVLQEGDEVALFPPVQGG